MPLNLKKKILAVLFLYKIENQYLLVMLKSIKYWYIKMMFFGISFFFTEKLKIRKYSDWTKK